MTSLTFVTRRLWQVNTIQFLQKLTSVQGNSCSEESQKLSRKHATESKFSEFVGKLWQLASLLKTYIRIRYVPESFQGNNKVLAQIYSSYSLESIVNIVVPADATKASGWKIEFHTWHTVPIRNAKVCFCKVICFIFLKLLMKVVQSYLYPKVHIPLYPMGYPVNVRLLPSLCFLFEI